MKKIIFIAFLCLVLNNCASIKMSILGVDVTEVVREEDIGMMIIGAGASVMTHVAGHYIAGELVGADIKQDGVREIITNHHGLSNSDKQWFARGGFLAQAITNTLLTSFEVSRRLKFTRGYTLATGLEVMSYPLRYSSEGDLYELADNGGNSEFEWTLYTATSLYNFNKINRKECLP